MWASLIFCSLHEIQSWRIVARPPDNLQRALPFQLESCINHKLKHSLIIYVWLFHLHNMMKMQPFYPVSPLSESMAEAFYWFLWSFKEKASTIFYGTAKNKARTVSYRIQPRIKAEGPVRGRGCFISTVWWEHTVFSSVVPFMGFMAEAFYCSFF